MKTFTALLVVVGLLSLTITPLVWYYVIKYEIEGKILFSNSTFGLMLVGLAAFILYLTYKERFLPQMGVVLASILTLSGGILILVFNL